MHNLDVAAGEKILDQPAAQLSGMWLSAIGALSFQVQPMMLGAYASVYELDDAQVGTLASIELTGAFLATLSALIWLRRVNWHKLMSFMLPLVTLAFLAAGWSRSFPELAAIRFVGGIGHGTIYVVAIAYLLGFRNPERLVGFSITVQLLSAAALFVALPQVEASLGLKGMVGLLGAVTGGSLLALIAFPREGRPVATGMASVSKPALGPGLLVVLGLLVFQMSLASIWAFIELMSAHSGIPMETTGGVLAITVPLAALGGIAAGLLGIRWGRALPLMLTAVATVIGLTILGTVATTTALFVGFLIQQFFWNFGIAYMFGMVAEFDGNGKLVALAPAAQTLGNALAPGLTGLLLSGENYLAVNYVSGSCAGLGVAILLVLIWRASPSSAQVSLQ